MVAKIKLKKGDTVIVNSGSEKGKKGEILSVDRKNGKVIVKGVNVRTMHVKARRQGQESGIIKKKQLLTYQKLIIIAINVIRV